MAKTFLRKLSRIDLTYTYDWAERPMYKGKKTQECLVATSRQPPVFEGNLPFDC